MPLDARIRSIIKRGVVIPAHPLALTEQGKFDERRQRALSRYYLAAGAGGLALGVHTTQFEIRKPEIGLFEPVLALAAEEMDRADASRSQSSSSSSSSSSSISCSREPVVRIGGICGRTRQAVREAELLRTLRYHAGLLSLGALAKADDDALLKHCRSVAKVIPLVGFYLQPAAGGRVLSHAFWRRFCEIPNVAAIKIAPFNRYRTFDVIRAVAEAGRDDIALYTGNDDHIVLDLLTPFPVPVNGRTVVRRFVGGLLGHWAVWTRKAVELLEECHRLAATNAGIPDDMLRRGVEVTDCNAAVFDAAHAYAGCIPGIHHVLKSQGLLASTRCLGPDVLSPGQKEEIARVKRCYPHLCDDDFVRAHLDEWLRASNTMSGGSGILACPGRTGMSAQPSC